MEGPTEIVIPEKRYTTCQSCRHYGSSMIQSGNRPIYNYYCNNPEKTSESLMTIFMGNLHKNMAGIIETPDWCPYLDSNNKRKVLVEKDINIVK